MNKVKPILFTALPIIIFFLLIAIAYFICNCGRNFTITSESGGQVLVKQYGINNLVVFCPNGTHAIWHYDLRFTTDISSLRLEDYHHFDDVNVYYLKMDPPDPDSAMQLTAAYTEQLIWLDVNHDKYCGSLLSMPILYGIVDTVTPEAQEYFNALRDFAEFYILDRLSQCEESLKNGNPPNFDGIMFDINCVKQFDDELGERLKEKYHYLEEMRKK